jgi:hypothetical protein
VTRTIGLDELPTAFDAYLKAGVTGRTVVKIAHTIGQNAGRA